MRVLIVTDAWRPQVNGVVRSLEHMAEQASSFGADVSFLTPERFRSVPMPTYPEIRLSLTRPELVARIVAEAAPDHVHIATEGPLGLSARLACQRQGRGFTTSYHTRFPEYAALRTGISAERFWPIMRRFHGPARAVLVATQKVGTSRRGNSKSEREERVKDLLSEMGFLSACSTRPARAPIA
mgnify:CR=1 FL=1